MSDFEVDVNVGGNIPTVGTFDVVSDVAPTFFTVIGDFQSLVNDTADDVDANPDVVAISATVTFTPMVATGDLILATNADPRPTAYVLAPIVATIDTDGRLIHAADAWENYDYTPVRLTADTPFLELSSPLTYSVVFSNVVIDGKNTTISSFNFEAPNADTEINLVTLARTPGQLASGINRIAPSAARFTDTDLIFYFRV